MSTGVDPTYSSPQDPAGSSGSGAQAKAHDAAGQAQEKAQAMAGQAQDRIREQVDQRSTQAGEQINEQAADLRSVGDALRDQGKDRPAQLADRVAVYAERTGRYLQDKNADSLLSDAEDFGRQKPAAVATGALAVGFMAARFLKASSSQRYAARQINRPSPAGQPTPTSDHQPTLIDDPLQTPAPREV